MSSPQPTQSPLARLVLFMICLALAGSFVAILHYFAVDLPQQNAVLAPENIRDYTDCEQKCFEEKENCSNTCGGSDCRNCLLNFWPCYHACQS
jgi:hypothetical protein